MCDHIFLYIYTIVLYTLMMLTSYMQYVHIHPSLAVDLLWMWSRMGLGTLALSQAAGRNSPKRWFLSTISQISVFIGVWTIPKWLLYDLYGIVLPTEKCPADVSEAQAVCATWTSSTTTLARRTNMWWTPYYGSRSEVCLYGRSRD